jgi:hypothetical protein
VYIEDDTVDVNGVQKTLPCLFAKYRVWKRNKNVIAAIRRLYSENKLFSSWEIATSAYEFKNGIKKITDYAFLSNCLLGFEFSSPAYGKDAKAISLSTDESQLLIAEALSHDILDGLNIDSTEKEDIDLAKNKVKEVSEEVVETEENLESSAETVENTETEETVSEINSEETETSTDSVEENTDDVETSALTDRDLRMKLNEACDKALGTWGWISFHFPVDRTVWYEDYRRESELDYILFTYEVNGDEITLSDPQNVKLSVSVSEINSKLDEIQSELSTKNEAIVKASEEIQSLKVQVSELLPFKELVDKAEQERIANEIAEKKENFIAKYKKSPLVTSDEFETSEEIKGFVETLNEKAMNDLIATRYMASLETETVETSEVEVKEKHETTASTNLVDDDVTDDKISVMKKFLRK